MGFTEEQLRAWVLDGGTRFVPPQNTYHEEYGYIEEVSAERKQLTDEDVRRALSMLGAAVEIDLAGAELLTDAIISEIGSRFSSLETLNLAYVELAARAHALSLPARSAHVPRSCSGSLKYGQESKLTDVSEIGRGCPNLTTLNLRYASPRAAPASRARRFRL